MDNSTHDASYRAMASTAMVTIARDLRQRHTSAENVLWDALRNRRLAGIKFRRQHPIAGTAFVADFFCYEARLVIELDGSIHAEQLEDDANREAAILEMDYRIIRFSNQQVWSDLEEVLIAILQVVHESDPTLGDVQTSD